MELPAYKIPSLPIVLHRMLERGWAFVRRAGTLIFAVTIVIWALLYYPQRPEAVEQSLADRQAEIAASIASLELSEGERENLEQELAAFDTAEGREKLAQGEAQRQSYLGRMGRSIEPAVRPLGWDWRMGCAVIASFPAREVVLGTLGVIYNLGDVDFEEDSGQTELQSQLQRATWDGTDTPVFNIPVALSLMVFFALCAQCAATLAVIKRETNSWRWPLFTFAYMTGLAYVAALSDVSGGNVICVSGERNVLKLARLCGAFGCGNCQRLSNLARLACFEAPAGRVWRLFDVSVRRVEP